MMKLPQYLNNDYRAKLQHGTSEQEDNVRCQIIIKLVSTIA
jgi:hypothetical protein